MNLDLLRSFLAIAEFGNLSQAAEQLHVSQSTLRRQMQTLESDRVSAVPRFNLHRSSLG